MQRRFVLDKRGEPRFEPDLDAWTRWFERADRCVRRTSVTPGISVVTTFRGVADTEEPGGSPLLFDTRVFGGALDGKEVKHRTRAAAILAHAALVEWCRLATSPGSVPVARAAR